MKSRPAGRPPGRGRLGLALAASACALAVSCSRRPPEATPEGAVREFVDRMRSPGADTGDGRVAFALLSKKTQANLTSRAQRYAAASGKPIPPEAMMVPSRFVMRFEPQRYSATIAGPHALVDVEGLQGHERARIACVYEANGWRLDLPLPSLAPVRSRPGTMD